MASNTNIKCLLTTASQFINQKKCLLANGQLIQQEV